jgi:hypothetical protein
MTLRGLALLFDYQPRFVLGDSESYLATELGGWIPNDRSWVYGLFVNGYLRLSHSLSALVLLQSSLTAVSFGLLAPLCSRLGVRSAICWGVLLFASVDPLHLYSDRALLTDAPAAALLLLGLLALMANEVRPSLRSSIGAACLLVLALVLRTAFVPLVLFAALWPAGLLCLQRLRRRKRPSIPPDGRLLPALALALVVVGSIVGYARLTGRLTGAPASLNPRNGYFLLGIFSPVLAPTDFRGLGVSDPEGLLLSSGSTDRARRNLQVYTPGGIDLRIEEQFGGDWRRVSSVGSIVVKRAVVRDPLGVLVLVGNNIGDYLTLERWKTGERMDLGIDRPLPPAMIARLSALVWEGIAPELPSRSSPILRWARATRWALPLLCWTAIVLPVVLVLLVRRLERPVRHAAVFSAMAIWIYLATVFVFSVDIGSRYLLPVQPLILVTAALLLETALRQRMLGEATQEAPPPRESPVPTPEQPAPVATSSGAPESD